MQLSDFEIDQNIRECIDEVRLMCVEAAFIYSTMMYDDMMMLPAVYLHVCKQVLTARTRVAAAPRHSCAPCPLSSRFAPAFPQRALTPLPLHFVQISSTQFDSLPEHVNVIGLDVCLPRPYARARVYDLTQATERRPTAGERMRSAMVS